jgi:CBS domain-containing protein
VKVADLMTRDARACTIHDSLNAAARIMWEHDCGCAPVVDGHGRLAGIVTDRDISMAAYTQGLPLEAIPIERVMSARVISCSRTDTLETAHRLMRTHEIHRIPVVDTRGRLIGIVTLSDLLNHSRGNSAEPSEAIEIAATFSAIHRRRKPADAAVAVSSNGDAPVPDAPKKSRARGKKPSANLR